MIKNEVNYDKFLLGLFSDFIKEVRDFQKSDLLKICYFISLLELCKFDEFQEELNKLQDDLEKRLLHFNLKLYIFNFIPSLYYLKFAQHEKNDYFEEFLSLCKDIVHFFNKIPDEPFCDFLRLNAYCLLFYNVPSFLTLKKLYAFDQECSSYLSLKKDLLKDVQEIADKYLDKKEDHDEMAIWKSLIFYLIGTVYSSLDLESKALQYYEKSLFYKVNIFALEAIIDIKAENEDTLDEAKSYLFSVQDKFKKEIEKTEYWTFFNTIGAMIYESENKKKAEEYYIKDIKIIECNRYKTINASYPYYNLAILKKDLKEYDCARKYLLEAYEILQNATGVKLEDKDFDNVIYFLDDFQDYLYELCDIDLLKGDISKNSDIKKSLNLLWNIVDIIDRNNFKDERASLRYDLALLESKYYNLKKNYEKAREVIESCLTTEENYLSNKQKSDLKSRLAYFYYKLEDTEKYIENITKALELDPKNETALKLIAQACIPKESKRFLGKEHWREIIPIGVVTLIFWGGIYFLGKVSYLKDFQLLIILITIPFIIVLLYPLINKIRLSHFEIELQSPEVPRKLSKKLEI
ncbi:hypothetical protein [Thermodesulfovibrio sp. 3462-1]|uniref:Tetratricopeptide repeat protein n=1 Tax=Thermodesulfovibrio obliviosus TaxID=3118332 RepID=A0AAU8H1U0_9BACT